MTELYYEDQMRDSLSKLKVIEDQLTILTSQKELLREQLKKWLEVNNLTEYDGFDSDNSQLWRLQTISSTRRSANFDYIETVLEPLQLKEAIKYTESSTFRCTKVKVLKSKTQKAPIGK